MRLGRVELTLIGKFGNNTISITKIMLDVEPPTRKPERLVLEGTEDPNTVVGKMTLYLKGMLNHGSLGVEAQYSDTKELFRIDPAFVTFSVRNVNDTPIIHLDKSTGALTPISLGHALVETSFGGLTSLTCVVVEEELDMNRSDHSNCDDLLRPNERVAKR